MSRRSLLHLLGVALAVSLPVCGPSAAAADPRGSGPSTIDDFLTRPGTTAIAHRGYGDNLGEDPTRPLENTVPAVRRAFREGAVVVEVDVVLTADGAVVALHDDFLADFTCVNTLTLDELLARLPFVTGLPAILNQARLDNRAHPDRVTGLVIVEMKPASPLCDPADVADARIASAIVSVIRRMGMED